MTSRLSTFYNPTSEQQGLTTTQPHLESTCGEPSPHGDALDGIELFGGLDIGVRRQLITIAQPQRYQRGDLLYAEGVAGDHLLLLMYGVAVLFLSNTTTRRATVAAVRSPGVLGEEALAGGIPRATSAEAAQDVFVMALHHSQLSELMRADFALADAARRWLAFQMCRLAGLRADDMLLDLSGRVAKTLLDTAIYTEEGPAVVKLSQSTLASLARGSRQRVNPVLKGFAKRGWLRIETGRIVIADLEAIQRRANVKSDPR
jgi:CRP/FNR family cyclic AMP-dependent transcriptional regulator